MLTDLVVSARLELMGLHRRFALTPPRERPAKVYHAIRRKIQPWQHRGKRLVFLFRNLATGNRPLAIRVGDVSIRMIPAGGIAFNFWSKPHLERQKLSFILRFAVPGITFLDVGANAGLFSLAVANKLKDDPGAIYAFEPCEATFGLLQANRKLNSLARIQVFRLALSDFEDAGALEVNASLKGGLNTLGRASHFDSEIVAQQTVPVTTLDSFLFAQGIARVDLMKVDVEGAERLVFSGARNLLSQADAPLILYEGYSWCTAGFGYHPVEIMWQLEQFGFELFTIDQHTGQVRPRVSGDAYDAIMVAVKPAHAAYQQLLEGGNGR